MLAKKVMIGKVRLQLCDAGRALSFSKLAESGEPRAWNPFTELDSVLWNEGSSSIHPCIEGSFLEMDAVQFTHSHCCSVHWLCSYLWAFFCSLLCEQVDSDLWFCICHQLVIAFSSSWPGLSEILWAKKSVGVTVAWSYLLFFSGCSF